jgi:hypothetical protein
MFRRSAFVVGLGLSVALAIAEVAIAGQIHPGDLIVTDFGNGTLDDVNPVSGASFVIASGFSDPQGVAIDARGTIFVSDIGTSTIDKVNPATGVVTTFSGNGVGTGPALDRPFEMTFSSGTLYVAEGGTPNGNTTAVYAIDANGNRTLVAGNNGTSNNLFKEFLAGLALDSKGNIFASAPTAATIYHVGSGTATPLTTAVLAFRASRSAPTASSSRRAEAPPTRRSGRSTRRAGLPPSYRIIADNTEQVRRSTSCGGSRSAMA